MMPRSLKAWERCEQSPFNGAHLWELRAYTWGRRVPDGAFCHHCDAEPPPEHQGHIVEALRTAREGAGVPVDWGEGR